VTGILAEAAVRPGACADPTGVVVAAVAGVAAAGFVLVTDEVADLFKPIVKE
jgi:hypothetical protein